MNVEAYHFKTEAGLQGSKATSSVGTLLGDKARNTFHALLFLGQLRMIQTVRRKWRKKKQA
jgi:hypothetical protein